jgi:hypothetical protein
MLSWQLHNSEGKVTHGADDSIKPVQGVGENEWFSKGGRIAGELSRREAQALAYREMYGL